MGDAGEGLIDADARIQERLEELARERADVRLPEIRDPDAVRELESLRLARAELQRQLESTAHERRRTQIAQAIAEVDHRMQHYRRTLEAAASPPTSGEPPAAR